MFFFFYFFLPWIFFFYQISFFIIISFLNTGEERVSIREGQFIFFRIWVKTSYFFSSVNESCWTVLLLRHCSLDILASPWCFWMKTFSFFLDFFFKAWLLIWSNQLIWWHPIFISPIRQLSLKVPIRTL